MLNILLIYRLGDGTNITRLSPVHIVGVSNVIQISLGAYHSLALLENGMVLASGGNDFGFEFSLKVVS